MSDSMIDCGKLTFANRQTFFDYSQHGRSSRLSMMALKSRMVEFKTEGGPAKGYLASPEKPTRGSPRSACLVGTQRFLQKLRQQASLSRFSRTSGRSPRWRSRNIRRRGEGTPVKNRQRQNKADRPGRRRLPTIGPLNIGTQDRRRRLLHGSRMVLAIEHPKA